MSIINGRPVGGGAPLKTLTFVDENGQELLGVVVGKDVLFDATADDVKTGKKFASDMGLDVGVNDYMQNAQHGTCRINPGESFTIPLSENDEYDYTAFQAMIATVTNSVAVEKVVLNDAVYNVSSGVKVSDVTKNHDTKSVDLNFVNDTTNVYVVNFITYK